MRRCYSVSKYSWNQQADLNIIKLYNDIVRGDLRDFICANLVEFSSAYTRLPLAVTISTSNRLSTAMPNIRQIGAWPPPSV